MDMSFRQFLFTGGPIMIPILICSLAALTIIINKWLYFKNSQTDVFRLKKEIFELVKDNKIKKAISLCDTNPSPVAQILKAGLLKFGSPREEIKEDMEYVSSLEIPKLESGLAALVTIANVSPLFGLLGTVMGMIIIFHAIQDRTASMNPLTPADLAGGIWQALITTLAGLVVAIPAFVAYNYFVNRIHNTVVEMERASSELVNLLTRLTESNTSEIHHIIE